MNTLLSQPEERPGFWPRQFSSNVTPAQSGFDLIVGVMAPILCFIFDPIVFNGNSGFTLYDLSPFKILVYVFSGLSIMSLCAWLLLRDRSGLLSGIIAGVLLAGSLCSLIIGLIILPLSVLGLLFLIGVLGFTPFLVFFVYLRNGIRAFNTAKSFVTPPQVRAMVLVGAILVVSPPVLLHWQISRMVTQSMNDLLRGDAHSAEFAVQRLRYVGWAADLDQVVWTYRRETDETRKATLAKAYKEITGEDISNRLNLMLD